MSKAPQKRDPKINPFRFNSSVKSTPLSEKEAHQDTTQKVKSSRYLPCTRCMGEGGMGGGCPKCGGTGYSE